MKKILFAGNLSRIIYLFAGIIFVFMAVNDRTWWVIPFAAYFIAMAIFKFGCASENCGISEINVPSENSGPLN